MTIASPPFNPYVTTNALGSFSVTAEGYVAGTALNDAAVRNALSGGILASTETIPMFGGVGIFEDVPTPGYPTTTFPSDTLGPIVGRATTLAAATAGQMVGFSVFDQAHAMVNTPQSPVPVAGNGGAVNYYRFGSGARIAVPCVASLASLEGGPSTAQVSWDFSNQQLVPYEGAFTNVTISGATWASTSGGQVTYTVGTNLTSLLSAGDYVTVTGIISTGGTGVGYNGTFVVVSVGATTVVVTDAQPSSPGTYSSGGILIGGGGVLPVKILDFNFGNSMIPVYNASTGVVTWNRSGNCAVLLI